MVELLIQNPQNVDWVRFTGENTLVHETVGSKGEPVDTKFQVDRRSQHGIFQANKA